MSFLKVFIHEYGQGNFSFGNAEGRRAGQGSEEKKMKEGKSKVPVQTFESVAFS
jgi:hypothetical protein